MFWVSPSFGIRRNSNINLQDVFRYTHLHAHVPGAGRSDPLSPLPSLLWVGCLGRRTGVQHGTNPFPPHHKQSHVLNMCLPFIVRSCMCSGAQVKEIRSSNGSRDCLKSATVIGAAAVSSLRDCNIVVMHIEIFLKWGDVPLSKYEKRDQKKYTHGKDFKMRKHIHINLDVLIVVMCLRASELECWCFGWFVRLLRVLRSCGSCASCSLACCPSVSWFGLAWYVLYVMVIIDQMRDERLWLSAGS